MTGYFINPILYEIDEWILEAKNILNIKNANSFQRGGDIIRKILNNEAFQLTGRRKYC